VRGRVAADEDACPDEKLADHIVAWPRKWPKGTKSLAPPRRELLPRRTR